MINKPTGITLAAILSSLLATVSAHGQQDNDNTAKASGWFKTCEENEANQFCNVQYRVVTNTGMNIISLNLISITGERNQRVFRIVVPTARSLPPGIQIRVDNKQATAIPYLYCRPEGCVAEVRLNDTLVDVFKKGGRLDVTTLNFQGQENPVPVTLKGFTAAFDGPPIDINNPNARQENLAEQVRKKAQETKSENEGNSE